MFINRHHIARQRYFDKSVHIKKVKDCISSKNEEDVIRAISFFGHRLGTDFYRQYPIGSKFVLDLAFPKEQFAIEVDGQSHKNYKQKLKDKQRDNFLRKNNWVILRILDEDFFGYKGFFYKHLINEIVEERRRQYQQGELYPVEMPDFKEE